VQAGNGSAARQRPGGPIWSQAAERFPPADRVLSTILTRQAAQYRDRTLFVFGETRWSYAERLRSPPHPRPACCAPGFRPATVSR
jgi:crotonobetaine/carnitine-CoA ligase